MAYKTIDNIIIENAHIFFKNFKGRRSELLCGDRGSGYGSEAYRGWLECKSPGTS